MWQRHPNGPAGPEPHLRPGFDSPTVDYRCGSVYNHSFSEGNAPFGVILGAWYVCASGAYRETMENGFVLFAHLLNLGQWDLLGVVQLPSEFTRRPNK